MRYFPVPTRHDIVSIVVILAACVAVSYVDLSPKTIKQDGDKEKAVVLSVDDSSVEQIGLLTQGTQNLRVRVLSGKWKGQEFDAANLLRAQMELDKIFKPGDKILVGIYPDADPKTSTITALHYYRADWTFILFFLFAALLLAFGGMTGFTALLSFVFSCLVIWKLLIPLCLQGVNPMLVALVTVTILSAVIIFLIAGFTKKGVTAFLGAFAGVLASCLLAWLFTDLFKINGAAMPYSQALLYSGYDHLNLAHIFIGGIFLGSSGAVMDLGMDIAAGMSEIVKQKPDISRKELILSGIHIGQSVVGTMTTTLLLAYSGGYLTLMMMFVVQGTEPIDFINNPLVACEVVKTIIGSFGLVLVAPLTAVLGGWTLK